MAIRRKRRGGLGGILRPRKGQGLPPTSQSTSRNITKPTTVAKSDKPSPQAEAVNQIAQTRVEVVEGIVNPIENKFEITTNEGSVSVDIPSSLPYIRNPYPDEVGFNPSKHYSSDGTNIKFQGKYPENFLTFENIDVTDLQSIKTANVSFNFIVQLIDGTTTELWTSPIFLNELKSEHQSNNPYRTKNTVTVAKVDMSFIRGYGTQTKFDIPEQYAEVKITNTVDTKQDVLAHINWLVSSEESLRQVASLGGWNLETTERLGFDHDAELLSLDGAETDQSSQEANTSSEIAESTEPITTTTETESETTNSPVNNLFPPFGVAGVFSNETRTYQGNGSTYRWSTGSIFKFFGNRGDDSGRWIKIGDETNTEPTTSTFIPKYNLPSNGGSKIICGELYRQGFLSKKVWEADQRFGKELFKTHPRIMLGYTFWARNVVKYMRNNPHNTKKLYRICKPWTEHMAYRMGISEKDNILGNITQKLGYIFSLIVYNIHQIKWGKVGFSYGK